MQLIQTGDATYCSGWQLPYGGHAEMLTKLPVTRTSDGFPDDVFYKAFFDKLDELIKTPLAFAILAPTGWAGERCNFKYDLLPKYGWDAVAWKESSHQDKTLVQLYMRKTGKPDLEKRPTPETGDRAVSYMGKFVGMLPYLGCSSILTTIDEPKKKFDIPAPKCYAGVDHKKILHFLRLARPASLEMVKILREEGFFRLVSLNWHSYWVRGKPGLGLKENCEY